MDFYSNSTMKLIHTIKRPASYGKTKTIEVWKGSNPYTGGVETVYNVYFEARGECFKVSVIEI